MTNLGTVFTMQTAVMVLVAVLLLAMVKAVTRSIELGVRIGIYNECPFTSLLVVKVIGFGNHES